MDEIDVSFSRGKSLSFVVGVVCFFTLTHNVWQYEKYGNAAPTLIREEK